MDQIHQKSILNISASLLLNRATLLFLFIFGLVLLTILLTRDSPAINWEKQIRVLAHFCRHLAEQALEALESAVCSQDHASKGRSLIEGLGAVSHVLCVVVAGRTQLFITLRQQLLRSALSPRLIQQQRHLSRDCESVQFSQRESSNCSISTETRQRRTRSGIRTQSVGTDKRARGSHDEKQSPLRKCRSEVVISSSHPEPPSSRSTKDSRLLPET